MNLFQGAFLGLGVLILIINDEFFREHQSWKLFLSKVDLFQKERTLQMSVITTIQSILLH